MAIPIVSAWMNEYSIPGIYLDSTAVDDSETPNLVDSRAKDTKRRLEQEIDRRMMAILDERRKRDKKRAELLAQWEAELAKPKPYRWQDEPWIMYQVLSCY